MLVLVMVGILSLFLHFMELFSLLVILELLVFALIWSFWGSKGMILFIFIMGVVQGSIFLLVLYVMLLLSSENHKSML